MARRLLSRRLALVPASPELARAAIQGQLSEPPAAPGWPHGDSLDALAMSMEPNAGPVWLITLDGAVIGECGTFSRPDEVGVVEIGYGLSDRFRGQGYATEAVGAMSAWLAGQADVQVIIAVVQADNLPSRRVLSKLGFVSKRETEVELTYRLDVEHARTRRI